MRAYTCCASVLFALACGGAVDPAATSSTEEGGGSELTAERWPQNRAMKHVFLSSALYTGNLGGVAGADAKCQALAQAANLPGTYKAWISDSQGHSPSTTFTRSTVPYALVNGRIIARSWTDLTDGTLRKPINLNEYGQRLSDIGSTSCLTTPAPTPHTATAPDGTAEISINPTYGACADWTSDDAFNSGLGGSWGNASEKTTRWTSACSGYGCPDRHPLYCFEQ